MNYLKIFDSKAYDREITNKADLELSNLYAVHDLNPHSQSDEESKDQVQSLSQGNKNSNSNTEDDLNLSDIDIANRIEDEKSDYFKDLLLKIYKYTSFGLDLIIILN